MTFKQYMLWERMLKPDPLRCMLRSMIVMFPYYYFKYVIFKWKEVKL